MKLVVCSSVLFLACQTLSAVNVYLTEVPDYDWYAGCFGTATGNLFGYWDRHGLPNYYQGPTNDGKAPLNSNGEHNGIRSLWASEAGFDGRPADQPGHMDDYWIKEALDFESDADDTYVLLSRSEHAPDCTGDFTGMSQKKWTNLNGECDGNINGFAFTYWDASGNKRLNFKPGLEAGQPAVDLQSGLRTFSQFRGYDADVFTQLIDFSPECPPGKGFSFEDLKREIDAGYPILLFMQDVAHSRRIGAMPKANPDLHCILAYGYYTTETSNYARVRSSWSSGDNVVVKWTYDTWLNLLPARGVIGFRPKPKIQSINFSGNQIVIKWDGPSSEVYNVTEQVLSQPHQYVLEKATQPAGESFVPVSEPGSAREAILENDLDAMAFYRVRLVE